MEDESSGIGAGTVAGVGATLAGGIGLLLNRKKAVKVARDFLRETKARDLTLDEAENAQSIVSKVTPDEKTTDAVLETFTAAKNLVKRDNKNVDSIKEAVIKQPFTMGVKLKEMSCMVLVLLCMTLLLECLQTKH